MDADLRFDDVFETDAHHAEVVCTAVLGIERQRSYGYSRSQKTKGEAAEHPAEA